MNTRVHRTNVDTYNMIKFGDLKFGQLYSHTLTNLPSA